ncbi:MAG TPA: FecR family protein [Burkholderiaceae bacterium]|jgi:hypothetical protein
MAIQANSIATKSRGLTRLAVAAFAAIALAATADAAQVVGTVTDVSGPLVARRMDGTIKVLAPQSTVEQGDTLVTEKGTYARIKFIDNGEITLRPNTQFKIENFSYEATKPEGDSAIFSLLKGGLRSITGLLGKRNKERFGLNTPTATIGIRGTTFIAEYVQPSKAEVAAYQSSMVAGLETQYQSAGSADAARSGSRTDAPQGLLPGKTATQAKSWQLAQNNENGGSQGLNPGLYVQVLDGTIHVTNGGGSQNFTAGQFGFTPGFQQPPIILPTNPGMQFSPPASFSSTGGGQGSNGGKPGDVDCIVR